MAPEQCLPGRAGDVGPPADVFGLGATLHHVLSGAPPFRRGRDARESRDPETRWPQLVRDPEPLPRRIPARLGDLVLRCLARSPSDRPAAAEIAGELEPLVAALPRPMGLGRR
jgi:serine/threonine-protein kinase